MSATVAQTNSQFPFGQGFGGQMLPQGAFGNFLGGATGQLGGLVGGPAGGIVGGLLGQQLGNLQPFQAIPQITAPWVHQWPYQITPYQLAPQGWFGNILGGAAPWIGGAFGQPGIGQQIGNVAGQLAQLLPLQAMLPYQAVPQFTPQAWFGNMMGGMTPWLGGTMGALFGQPQFGQSLLAAQHPLVQQLAYLAAVQLAQQGQLATQPPLAQLLPYLAALQLVHQAQHGAVPGGFGQQGLGMPQQFGGIPAQLAQQVPYAGATPQYLH